jgi:uncharacterized repeat protein (TIGR03803 family)
MGKFGFGKIVCLLALLLIAAAIAPAQTVINLLSFDGTDGAAPQTLLQATDGNLYGVTADGGTTSNPSFGGTVFNITPGGSLTTLYNFCSLASCTDGGNPAAGLFEATDLNFYGVTNDGGADNLVGGTLFEIGFGGGLTTLYSLNAGTYPRAPLIEASSGKLYGTTGLGGTGTGCPKTGYSGCGTIFEMGQNGGMTTFYSFCSQADCHDGADPNAGLIVAPDGHFYGTTFREGGYKNGTFFVINPAGTLTTLHSFHKKIDGSSVGQVILASNGNFYGTAQAGGANPGPVGPAGTGAGTVFEITPQGQLTVLHNFCSQPNCTDGAQPMGVVEGSDGNLYGTTYYGGIDGTCDIYAVGCGTLFQITPSGTLTTLYSFCAQPSCADGAFPGAPPMQSTNGTFYGTTAEGGGSSDGTVYTLSMGLGSFVQASPGFGLVGRNVSILGYGLTGTTAVTFNGTPANFTVVSDTFIKTNVPMGATTGTIEVTTPGGTLASSVAFVVNP